MDGQRFDDLARLVGAGASRRRMLKGLAGAFLGVAGIGATRRGAVAGCIPIFTSGCTSTSECCEGLICRFIAGTTFACEPPPPCEPEGDNCGGLATCCDGTYCEPDFHVCTAYPACWEIGADCLDDTVSCCAGSQCTGGECVADVPACSGEGQGCAGDENCCDDLICVAADCVAPPTCAAEGEDCAEVECCDGLECVTGGGVTICAALCAGEGESCGLLDGDDGIACCEGYACNSESECEAIAAPDCTVDDDCGDGEICCGYGDGNVGCVAWECCGVEDDDHCGAGDVCTAENTCEAAAPAAECKVDADCVLQAGDDDDAVAAICCGGFCITGIECCIDDETPNDRCPEGAYCFEGVCEFACKGDSDCAGDTCCCADGSCHGDCCEGAETPTDTGGVTTLPNTGVADSDGGLNGLLGATLVAGAAAYLAGKKLKGSDEA